MPAILPSLAAFALAGALSSVPASITMMILLSPVPRRGALPFLCGTLAGSVTIVGLSAVGLHFLQARPNRDGAAFPALLGFLAGLALAGYAVFLISTRGRGGTGRMERLQERFGSSRGWKFAALGVGLNLRPKAVLMAVAAGALIGVRNLAPVEGSALVLAYAVVAQSAVVAPIGYWLSSPERAQAYLAQSQRMAGAQRTDHNRHCGPGNRALPGRIQPAAALVQGFHPVLITVGNQRIDNQDVHGNNNQRPPRLQGHQQKLDHCAQHGQHHTDNPCPGGSGEEPERRGDQEGADYEVPPAPAGGVEEEYISLGHRIVGVGPDQRGQRQNHAEDTVHKEDDAGKTDPVGPAGGWCLCGMWGSTHDADRFR